MEQRNQSVDASDTASKRIDGRVVGGIVAGLLVLFAALSYSAAVGKSPTYDEPLHAVAGYAQRWLGDYRLDPEDGALFTFWSTLPHRLGALHADPNDPWFVKTLSGHDAQWPFCVFTLFPSRVTDDNGGPGDRYVQRSRFAFTVVGVLLGATIAWWSWRLGGAIAAVTAATLFALDPNFLGHASLVKNDVPLALLFTSLMYAVWQLGRRATLWRVAIVALLCGAAVSVKFSGLLLGPIVALTLLVRAILPQPWQVLSRELLTRAPRVVAAVAICVVCALVAWGSVWTVYGFRYAPARGGGADATFPLEPEVGRARLKELQATLPGNRMPTKAEFDAHQPGRVVRAIEFCEARRLLPQAWLHGLLYTYSTTLVRGSYLDGAYSVTGWWYFFPLAMLYKTPLATLIAGPAVIGALIATRKMRAVRATMPAAERWTAASFLVPVGVYLVSALTTNLNLGLRHVLPLYPFLFIAIGVGMATLMRRWPRGGKLVAMTLLAGLFLESAIAWPNYIAFFNSAAGGIANGATHLSDSNLDWGQDLKLLREWQIDHPDTKLYLCYFGMADPRAYNLKFVNMPGSWPWIDAQIPDGPGVLALSATNLQGTYFSDDLRRVYAQVTSTRDPIRVLGGTIYLYELGGPSRPAPPALPRP